MSSSNSNWRHVLRLSVVIGCMILVGLVFDFLVYAALFAVLCCLGWIVRSTVQVENFLLWVKQPRRRPPKSTAMFSSVVQSIDTVLRKERERASRLLNTAQSFKQMFDGLPDACVLLDENLGIIAMNARAYELIGLTPQDTGKNIATFLRHPNAQQLLWANGSAQGEVEVPSPMSENVSMALRLLNLKNNNHILIARDVSAVKRILAMREDFIANVSHELSTPLTVLIGYIESLSDQELDHESVTELITRLPMPAQRMKSLVQDLMTLSMLAVTPEPEPELIALVDVPHLIENIIEDVQPLLSSAHTLETHIEHELKVHGVSNELQSAFLNLITNALRYTPKGGKITIRWEHQGDHARFEVTDDGIGIPSNHIPRITERFYRVEPNTSRATGGTGLGLAIVKHVLLRHQSKLAIESKVGQGSTFSCDLPLQLSFTKEP